MRAGKIIYQLLRSRPKIAWVGDSHAAFIAADQLVKPWSRSLDGDLVFWLGPELAFNYRARTSFQGWRRRVLAWSSIEVAVFVLGEIDVRVHLGNDEWKMSTTWVQSYVNEVAKTMQLLRLTRAVILGPVPPSANAANNQQFPIRGTADARVSANEWLTVELQDLCRETTIDFVPLNQVVADSKGYLHSAFERDGCHLNSDGAYRVRARVYEVISNK